MLITVISYAVFFSLLLYWLHGEKRKMYLYELWIDVS